MKVATKKPAPVVKVLNETQQAHALNRLSTMYQEAIRPLQNNTGKYLNWLDGKEVEAFIRKYKIPAIDWQSAGAALFAGHALRGELYTKMQDALNQYHLDSMKDHSAKVAQASLLLARAQDAVIFGSVAPGAVASVLTEFGEALKVALA